MLVVLALPAGLLLLWTLVWGDQLLCDWSEGHVEARTRITGALLGFGWVLVAACLLLAALI